MALFGRKKREDVTPESLGFGFPATEKKKDTDILMPEDLPEVPGPEANPELRMPEPVPMPQRTSTGIPPQVAQQFTAIPIPERPAQPLNQGMMPQQQQQMTQAPMYVEPLEPRPVMPMTPPEDIRSPQAPAIQKLRPHVFLKVSKYKEVMTSIDKIMSLIRDLGKSLKNMRDVEEKEALRIKESEELLVQLGDVAEAFDRIFSSPEK